MKNKSSFIKLTSNNYDKLYEKNKKNPLLEDIKKNPINSYKLRIYKRYIKDDNLFSSSIVYNFMTKELRLMVKGVPEEILNKCDINSIPEKFEIITSFFRINGYIIIICATKLLNIEEYNDSLPIDYYIDNLTFCGFIILRNKTKTEIKYSVKISMLRRPIAPIKMLMN